MTVMLPGKTVSRTRYALRAVAAVVVIVLLDRAGHGGDAAGDDLVDRRPRDPGALEGGLDQTRDEPAIPGQIDLAGIDAGLAGDAGLQQFLAAGFEGAVQLGDQSQRVVGEDGFVTRLDRAGNLHALRKVEAHGSS